MSMVVNTLKWFGLLLAGLVVLLLALVSWVVATDTGFSQAVSFSQRYWPEALSIDRIEGNLYRGLTLYNVSYQVPGVDAKVDSAYLQLSLLDIFSKELHIEQLLIEQPKLSLGEMPETEPSPSEPFSGLTLPVDLIVDQARVNNGTLTMDKQVHVLESLTLQLAWIEQQLELKQLDVAAGPSPFFQTLTLNAKGELETTAKLPMAVALKYSVQPEGIDSAQGTADITGTIDDVRLESEHTIRMTDAPESANVTLNAEVSLAKQTLDASLEGQAPTVVALGDQWLSVSPLSVNIRGPFDQLKINALATTAGEPHVPVTDVRLLGTLTPRQLTLSELAINSAPLKLNTQASFVFETQELTQTLSLKQLNPGYWDPALTGNISGTSEVKANVKDLSVERLLTNIKGTLGDQPFTLSTKVTGNAEAVTVHNATLAQGTNRVRLNGTISPRVPSFALNATLDAPNLTTLHPTLSGRADATATINGPLKALALSLNANAQSVTATDTTLDTLALSLTAKGNTQQPLTMAIDGRLQAQGLTGGAQIIERIDANIKGQPIKHKAEVSIDSEQLDTRLALSGGVNKQSLWVGRINQHQLDVSLNNRVERWQLTDAPLTVGANTLKLDNACWRYASGGAICATLEQTPTRAMQADVSLDALPLAMAKPWLPEALTLEGTLNGDIKLNPARNQLAAEIQWLDGAIDVDAQSPYRTQVSRAVLSASVANQTLSGQLAVALTDQSEIQGNINLSSVNLAAFEPSNMRLNNSQLTVNINNTDYIADLTPEISNIRGPINIDINARGPLLSPNIDGQIALAESVGIARTNTEVKNITVALKPVGDDISVDGRAMLGDGELSLSGQVSPSSNGFNLTIRGQELLLMNTEDITAYASPDLSIQQNQQGLNIKGKVHIPKASIIIASLPPSAIQPSSDIVILNQPPIEQKDSGAIAMDVVLSLGDEVVFSALGLDSNIEGQLKLQQASRQALSARGQLDLVNGHYAFLGQKLTIDEGKLYFNGPISDPRIYVKAVRKTPDATAGIQLEGTVDQLESTLYSTPELAEAEILSYLLTGKSLSSEGGGSEDELTQAALLMGLKQTTGALGLGNLAIDSSEGVASSTVSTGKQINDKLYVGYEYGIFSRTGAWLLEYTLTQQLQLESSFGDSQSVDLIYEIKKP